MRCILCLLMVVVCSSGSGVRAEDRPSPIPKKLQSEAEKAFAQKKLYFIWADPPTAKLKDLRLSYAVNPNPKLKEEEGRRVMKIKYRARGGQMVPFSHIEPGITGVFSVDSHLKGQGTATIYLIKDSDVLTPNGVNPDSENVPARSNVITLNVAFE